MKNLYFLFAILLSLETFNSQTCTNPTLSVPNATICEQNSATLTATTTGTQVKWYDSATSTTPVFVGNPYTTPNLTTTTSYWAEAYNYTLGQEMIGGKTTPGTSSSAVNTASDPWGLSFTTTSDFSIGSVDVFASAGGTLVVQLLTDTYALIEQKTFTIPAGGTSSAPLQHTISLDFFVSAGNTYRLVATSSPSMRRDLSNNSFPYDLAGLGSITGGTINSNPASNSGVYYYFYNWKVKTVSGTCPSGRVQSTITVTNTPAPTASNNQNVPANSTLADLTVSGQNLIWYSDSGLTTQIPSSTTVTNGTTYYVTQTANSCESSATAITVTTSLSTNEAELAKGISIYPNPVSDIIHINSKYKIISLSIYDSSGKIIKEVKSASRNMNEIDVSNLPVGKYILMLDSSAGNINYPFIKK